MSSLAEQCPIKHYVLVGRHRPKSSGDKPQIFRMKIFAPNAVVAKSRFWFFLSSLRKVKRANGEILHISEVQEKEPGLVKIFGVWIRYNSRSGTHNMYREYRDTHLTGAVAQMYDEMGSKHHAGFDNIQIIKTATVPKEQARRANTIQFLEDDVKFPLIRSRQAKVDKKYKTLIKFGSIKRTW